jgi:hypothetical protein
MILILRSKRALTYDRQTVGAVNETSQIFAINCIYDPKATYNISICEHIICMERSRTSATVMHLALGVSYE